MKLELKHLAPYFPYNLKVIDYGYEWAVTKICLDVNQYSNIEDAFGDEKIGILEYIKPLLRPLSSITKEEALELVNNAVDDTYYKAKHIHLEDINKYDDMVFISYGVGMYNINLDIDTCTGGMGLSIVDYGGQVDTLRANYKAFQFLFKKHFDIFGLIKNGLAIEKQS